MTKNVVFILKRYSFNIQEIWSPKLTSKHNNVFILKKLHVWKLKDRILPHDFMTLYNGVVSTTLSTNNPSNNIIKKNFMFDGRLKYRCEMKYILILL